ncbi:hypothetical protein GGF31_004495 [Allomyces arbusculus]|nr:hypothetical protein GGF31_004495 [Allomyces arbusculus]
MSAKLVSDTILDALPAPIFTPFLRTAYEAVVGAPLDSFDFEHVPLSSGTIVAVTAVTYVAVIFGGQAYLRATNTKPFTLQAPFFVHNVVLSLFSGFLFLAMAENVVPIILRHGLFHAICDERGLTKELLVLYYLNYLTKYYELIDTIFLVLKRKPLAFLHWYHHSLTMVLCWTQLAGAPTVQWVPILINLLVHVIMYMYYGLTAIRIRVPTMIKKSITTLQITQFVVDLVAIYYAAYHATYWHWSQAVPAALAPFVPVPTKPCTGTLTAAYFGCALITSYLFLFIDFFVKTYSRKPSGDKKGGKVKKE